MLCSAGSVVCSAIGGLVVALVEVSVFRLEQLQLQHEMCGLDSRF